MEYRHSAGRHGGGDNRHLLVRRKEGERWRGESAMPRGWLHVRAQVSKVVLGSLELIKQVEQSNGTVSCALWRNAIARDEGFGVAIGGEDTWWCDGLVGVDVGGDLEVEGEELGEEVGFCIETVRVEDGGVEGGVGVF